MQKELLGERYELQEPIGRGGMATIYKALDTHMDRTVAVKVLRDVYSTDPKFVIRFRREAQAASMLAHPNIVQVYDYGQSKENYYIVMEFVQGTDLRKYLRTNGILSVQNTVAVAHDVASALGAAHRRGIVHRDVKPQNILVNEEGIVKLADFGIASLYGDISAERLTTTGMTLGTVQYYSPEQAQGEVVTPPADVYALGIVMYEMLTGHPPFDGETPVAVAVRHLQEEPVPPSQLNPAVSEELEGIILKCLSKDPAQRYQDGNVLADALEKYEQVMESGTVPEIMAARLPQKNKKNGSGVPRQSVTKPIGAAPGTLPRTPSYPDTQNKKTPSRTAGLTTALIGAAALLMLAVSCFLASQLGWLPALNFGPAATPTATIVNVPSLLGLQIDDARVKAQQAGFSLNISSTAPDPDGKHPSGTIISQNPSSNGTAAKGSTINVVVSSGEAKVEVPDVQGLSLSDAETKLQQANLRLGNVQLQVSDQPPGTVITQSPAPHSLVDPTATQIDLVVSQSPTPTPTSTPVPPTVTPTNTPTSTVPPVPTLPGHVLPHIFP